MGFRVSKFGDIDLKALSVETIVYCDTLADLPTTHEINQYHLTMGCRAIIVSNGDRYILNSSGSWIRETNSGGGGGGEQEVVAHTVEEWGELGGMISEYGVIYVYTDYTTQGGYNIAALKIGDGVTSVTDLPFYSTTTTSSEVVAHTVAEWNVLGGMTSEYGVIYIYSDYAQHEGVDIPAMKIGDGNAHVADLPFFYTIGSSQPYITYEDIDRWNSKISVKISPTDSENLVFYND